MSDDDYTFDFSSVSGAAAAEEAAKSSKRDRPGFWSLTDGQSCLLRFINDADPNVAVPQSWITVRQHSMVPTKPRPKDVTGNWPKSMGAMCRNAHPFSARYDGCPICQMTNSEGKKLVASSRTWALALEREEVIEGGQVVGIRTKTKEVQSVDDEGNPKGDVRVVPSVVVINQGWKNFFAHLSGFAGRYGTVVDRDYYITRKGATQNDTTYQIVPAEPLSLDDGSRLDLRRPEVVAMMFPEGTLPNLAKIVAEQASDDYFGRFFFDLPEKGKSGGAQQPAAPSSDQAPDANRLAALRERMTAAAAPAAQPTAAAQPRTMRNFT